ERAPRPRNPADAGRDRAGARDLERLPRPAVDESAQAVPWTARPDALPRALFPRRPVQHPRRGANGCAAGARTRLDAHRGRHGDVPRDSRADALPPLLPREALDRGNRLEALVEPAGRVGLGDREVDYPNA